MVNQQISVAQIKAALALLDWTYDDLVSASGVSKPTVARFLAGNHRLSDDRHEALVRTLVERDIQFLPNNGVAQYRDTMRRITGPRALNELLDDVYETVKNGGDLCVSGVSETLFDKYHKEEIENEHADRMTLIKDKLDFRVMLEHGDTNFAYNSYVRYRWMPKGKDSCTPFYMYNNKTAFIKLTGYSPEVFLFDHPSMAAAFKDLFDMAWETCTEPNG